MRNFENKGKTISEKHLREIELFLNKFRKFTMTQSEHIHSMLDQIFDDPDALSHFNHQLISVCLQALVADMMKNGKMSEQEFQEQSKRPSPKILEQYGVTYQQYRALLSGNGTYKTYITFKRILERNGFDFEKLFYSEKLIKIAYEVIERKNSGDFKFSALSQKN
jgi:hypothetical protein